MTALAAVLDGDAADAGPAITEAAQQRGWPVRAYLASGLAARGAGRDLAARDRAGRDLAGRDLAGPATAGPGRQAAGPPDRGRGAAGWAPWTPRCARPRRRRWPPRTNWSCRNAARKGPVWRWPGSGRGAGSR